jgi:hypothetical protein
MRRIDPESNSASYDLDFVVDKVPYNTRVTPMDFNGEKRFKVQINSGDEHVFAWDEELMALKALDDEGAVLPDDFVRELSDRLVRTRHL